MAFLGKEIKSDLQHAAAEFRMENLKVIKLKNTILAAINNEEEFMKEFLNLAIKEHKNKAEKERKKNRGRENKSRGREIEEKRLVVYTADGTLTAENVA